MQAITLQHTTGIVSRLSAGDGRAAHELFPLVYEELRALAGGYLRQRNPAQTLSPTALVHEAYLRMVDQTAAKWNDRSHFFAVAATAMRQILISHARRRLALKRGGQQKRINLDSALVQLPTEDVDLLALDEALERLAQVDARKARVVEARFFGGLTSEEVAGVMGVSLSTVESDWRFARAWLSRELTRGTADG